MAGQHQILVFQANSCCIGYRFLTLAGGEFQGASGFLFQLFPGTGKSSLVLGISSLTFPEPGISGIFLQSSGLGLSLSIHMIHIYLSGSSAGNDQESSG